MVGHEGCMAMWRQTRPCHGTRAIVHARHHGCRQQRHSLRSQVKQVLIASLQ